MSSALYMTTKIFCKRAWLGALLAVCLLVAGPFALIKFVQFVEGTSPLEDKLFKPFDYHFAYLGVSWVLFIAVVLAALQGIKKVVFSLPVSSSSIFSWLIFFTAGLFVFLNLITNGLYRIFFFDKNWLADYWPLSGPTFFIVTVMLVGHCIYWSMHARSFTQLFCWIGLIIVMFYWFIARYYPNGFHEKIVPWNHVTLFEFVAMQMLCIAAWWQGTRALKNVRNGNAVPSWQWKQLSVFFKNLVTGARSSNQSIPDSRQASLANVHWRDSCRGAVLIGGVVFGIVVLVINLMTREAYDANLIQHTDGFLVLTMMFSLVAGVITAVLLGERINGPGRTELKLFLAMAPLTDRDFAATLFWNMFKTSFLIIILIEAGLILSFVGVMLMDVPQIYKSNLYLMEVAESCLYFSAFSISGYWILFANMISVYWTGRTWFYYLVLGVLCGCFGLFVAMLLFINRVIDSQIDIYLLVGFLLSMSLLILGGTATAYVVACRKKLMKVSTAVIVLLLWLFGASLGFYLNYESPQTSNDVAVLFLLIFFISIFSLAVTPFATIPLALVWNRHR